MASGARCYHCCHHCLCHSWPHCHWCSHHWHCQHLCHFGLTAVGTVPSPLPTLQQASLPLSLLLWTPLPTPLLFLHMLWSAHKSRRLASAQRARGKLGRVVGSDPTSVQHRVPGPGNSCPTKAHMRKGSLSHEQAS